MKAKSIVFKAASLIVALLVAVFTVGYAFAWLVNRKDADLNISGGSAGAYFDSTSGNGTTPEQAFIISNPTHMHNLAVLQNTGRFGTTKYYFKIKNDVANGKIDMSGHYIPPIGNDEYPFIGDFNGNGKTLANLQVTTDKEKLKEEYPFHANASYKFSQAVGLFGMTGNSIDGEKSNIHNVILENPSVEVSNSNTLYSDKSAENKSVGLAVGHVAGQCSSIGVKALTAKATALDIQVTGYSTFNSILGELGEGVESSVTGGGHTAGTGGSGAAFGASFDVDQLADRLKAIKNNNGASPFFPQIDTANNIPVPQLGYKVPFSVDASKSNYTGVEAKEIVANNNIGYDMGNQNKITSKTLGFTDNLMQKGDDGTYYLLKNGQKVTPTRSYMPRWFYTQNDGWENSHYQERVGFGPISQEKYYSLPENVQKLLYTENHSVMRIQAGYTQYQTAAVSTTKYDAESWGYHGQISWMGKTYGEGINREGYVANELGYWLDAVSGGCLDENGYVFFFDEDNNKNYVATVNIGNNPPKYNEDGTMQYPYDPLWYYKNEDGSNFNAFGEYSIGESGTLINRDGSDVIIVDVWGDKNKALPLQGSKIPMYSYTKGVAMPNNGLWFKPASAGTARFVMYAESDSEAFCLLKITRTKADRNNPFYTVDGTDITVQKVIQQQLPVYVLFYYEIEINQTDIDNGNVEYLIMVDNNVKEEGSDKETDYKGAFFVYLDLGASAAEDTSGIDTTKQVSAVDFIYDEVEIKQGDPSADGSIKVGDFIVQSSGVEALYDSTKTSVYFENITKVLNLVYLRLHNDSTNSDHSGKTICLEGSTEGDDKKGISSSSEVKATFATYVCPQISGGSGSVSGGGSSGGGNTPTTVAVTGVTLDSSSQTLSIGQTATLTATIAPANATNKNLTWTTSDSNIVTVDGGTITAVNAGTATITVTTEDGGFTATCEVTVSVPAATEYTVSFNLNYDGAMGAPASQTVEENSTAITPNAPTREGYTFGGWYTNASCTGTAYDFTTPVIEDITLYAKWMVSGSATTVAVLDASTTTLTGTLSGGTDLGGGFKVASGGGVSVSNKTYVTTGTTGVNSGELRRAIVTTLEEGSYTIKVTFTAGGNRQITVGYMSGNNMNELGKSNSIKEGTAEVTIELTAQTEIYIGTVSNGINISKIEILKTA